MKIWLRELCFVCMEILVVGVLPALMLIRVGRKLFVHQKLSVWTGAPIVTMPVKALAERRLGFRTVTLVRSTYFITKDFDINVAEWSRGIRILQLAGPYLFFLWVCSCCTHVHAYADGGLLPSKRRLQFNPFELLIYRLLGIRIFIWTYGADVRTRSATQALGEPNCCSECKSVGSACICSAEEGKENYSRLSRFATAIFSMGDMVEYTPGSRNDLFFWPIDLLKAGGQRYRPVYPSRDGVGRLRVVHAPNHRAFKGTRFLEEAISELQSEGVPIDLIMVEKMANDEALAIYRTADVIFDQCMIGFHGYFALEAMALGKPVICYIRAPRRYLLSPDECPIINIHKAQLKERLRRLATADRSELHGIGMRSRAYVERCFSVDAFANRLEVAYRDLGVIV